ncbi:LacI family DNA-binding transcriptional regulator [Paenibacillus radicis (ex Xue et al. 2023)]|uniref:LacI family transcriptional regulator n=1 Tax=Paenibacillus radicis (ex Xue et al. 2023) TaxID=2972489 RepID=A0ABT1YQ62_9BACL|nr:LacI family DNA-binding transcriptional regulator [Paenibacillus radicis (ex Xue et al. 2023)]MCR8635318.1 LacI family transcriptional regulator [Paenibacillus radicis (ex Xue et al. 2023)]
MNRRVRQQDIARKLGVSINTVSLALKDSGRINEDTKLKVQEVAKALNYIPNSIARSLVQKRTFVIGFILPSITNPIQIETAQNIERKLLANGYNMMLMTSDYDKNYETKALDILLSRQVDGIFMFPTDIQNQKKSQEKIKAIRDANYPIILLSGGNFNLPSDSVYMNQYLGAYKATRHLTSMGHKEIAIIYGGARNTEKHQGYIAALKDSGLEYNPNQVATVGNSSYEQGYRAASKILRNGSVTAILASGDYLALGALRWCREQGLRVPEDVAIIGFDDLEASRFAEIPLTTITYKVEELTTRATELLFSLISDQETSTWLKPRKVEIEPTLVVRQSCGFKKRSGELL